MLQDDKDKAQPPVSSDSCTYESKGSHDVIVVDESPLPVPTLRVGGREVEVTRSGQPSKYKQEYAQELVDWFEERAELCRTSLVSYTSKKGDTWEKEEEKPNPPPTFYGFAARIGVAKATLNHWEKKHPEFKKAMDIVRGIQAEFIISNGMTGKAPANFAALMMKNNHGWKDKTEQELTHKTTLEKAVDESFKDEDE